MWTWAFLVTSNDYYMAAPRTPSGSTWRTLMQISEKFSAENGACSTARPRHMAARAGRLHAPANAPEIPGRPPVFTRARTQAAC